MSSVNNLLRVNYVIFSKKWSYLIFYSFLSSSVIEPITLTATCHLIAWNSYFSPTIFNNNEQKHTQQFARNIAYVIHIYLGVIPLAAFFSLYSLDKPLVILVNVSDELLAFSDNIDNVSLGFQHSFMLSLA